VMDSETTPRRGCIAGDGHISSLLRVTSSPHFTHFAADNIGQLARCSSPCLDPDRQPFSNLLRPC
jgi:hypothetical protein